MVAFLNRVSPMDTMYPFSSSSNCASDCGITTENTTSLGFETSQMVSVTLVQGSRAYFPLVQMVQAEQTTSDSFEQD